MKKIIVIGCAGAGKSVFSRALRDKIGLPLYHLDLIYWREDGTTLEKSAFQEILQSILDRDEWIIDGNYSSTMELRVQACDTVIFLDYPTEVCLDGIAKRAGKYRSDMAWKQAGDIDDAEFVEFVKNYNLQNRPRVIELLENYTDKRIVVFKSREESERYLKSIKI